jgi:3-deoxy-D-manno-octulosonic-acid transferase
VSAARAAYTLLVFIAMPFAALYLLWRSRRQPEYRRHWSERFGWMRRPEKAAAPLIWIHAVSVGETQAARPLIDALAVHFPAHHFLLTHMTPTGRATGAEIAARWPGRLQQAYLPYDMPFAVRRFLRSHAPLIGLGMETETWPNLLAAAHAAGVAMVLVNARLSERSLARAQWTPGLMAETAQRFTLVLAQTEPDAARMRQVGAQRIEVIGNLKFDTAPDAALVERGQAFRRASAARAVLLFASTREGEEGLLLDALRRHDLPAAGVTVIFVPRHPQRFDEVARLLEASFGTVERRSSQRADAPLPPGSPVILGDSMGEMTLYYAASDVAYVGGSLLPLGGQNLIEACAVAVPVVVGPHTFNFSQVSADAIAARAAVQVDDADAVVEAMQRIAGDATLRARMADAGLRFARQHSGATARALARIAPLIEMRSRGYGD